MIYAQTRVWGVSVSQVARRYDVNANQVFNWLKDPRFISAEAADGQVCFLPVEITEDVRHEDEPPLVAGGRIAFDLAGGHRFTVSGSYTSGIGDLLMLGIESHVFSERYIIRMITLPIPLVL